MTIPAIILIVLFALSLGIGIAEHGKPKEGKNNFWISLVSTGIVFGLLYWGGFFK